MSNLRTGFLLQLNNDDKTIAARELGEDPKQTATRLQSLREAVLQMKHLTAPTDDDFLLLFLRHAKFSQTRALQVIDNFVKHRVTEPYSELYINDGAMDETSLKTHKRGTCLVLPTLPESGIRTLIFRSGLFDSADMSLRQAFRAAVAGTEIVLRDPVSQVRGIQYIADDFGVGTSYYTQFLSLATVKVVASAFLNVMPCRMKGLHFYRSPVIVRVLISLLRTIVSTKIASRIFVHATEESLHAAISREILPTELGGTAGSYEQMCAISNELNVSSHRGLFEKYTRCAYDESKKVAGSVPTESFRTLNID